MTSLLPHAPKWFPRSRGERLPASAFADTKAAICSWRWTAGALALVAAVVLFYRLDSFRTLGSHEVYAVVPAREMLAGGDWVLPTFGELPRLRKPPLAYWVVAGSATLFGELTPLTARLPAAISGLLLAGLMGLWAARWYGGSAGWAAAFVQLTSVWVMIFARKAEIDMLLCLLTTTALFLIADQPRQESSRRASARWLGIYVLLSMAWLAKFHYGPAMVLAPAVGFYLIERRRRQLRSLLHPLGLTCFAAAIVVWPLLVLRHVPDAWQVWHRETIGRAVGKMGEHPAWFYLPYLIWLPLPWTFFAVATMRQSWRAAWKNRDARERFLWIWFLTQMVIVTLSANKHKHYLLASLPMLTLLAARSLSDLLRRFHDGRLRISFRALGPLLLLNLAGGAGLAWMVSRKWPALTGPALALGGIVAVGWGAGWLCLARRNVRATVAVNVVSVVLSGVVLTEWILPRTDPRLSVQQFAGEIREEFLPGERVCTYRMDRDAMVYHLGAPVFRRESLDGLKPMLHPQEPLYVIGYEPHLRELSTLGELSSIARLPQDNHGLEPRLADVVLIKLTPHPSDEGSDQSPIANDLAN